MLRFQAGLGKIPQDPNQFALVIFGTWHRNDIPPKDAIKRLYKSIKRKNPEFLEFGSGYEDQLKNWLCKPQHRKSDLIARNGIGGIGMYCHGIETDVVLHVGSTCKKGCFSMLNPVPMTRAKSMLILSKFEPVECVPCNMASNNLARILQPHLTASGGYNEFDVDEMTWPPEMRMSTQFEYQLTQTFPEHKSSNNFKIRGCQ